ncbi:MAG: ABC transporter permease subunit [Cyanobacteria bacterium SZAS-4]|nr:ABC transporter permease subunit [Cyanobacteria bacterium SZAS-4]
MSIPIFIMTLKQFWNRPARVFLLGCFLAFPLFMEFMMKRVMNQNISAETASHMVPAFVMVIGAGIVGQDITDGVLPLILSRPIKRYQYLISKWMAVATLALSMGLADTSFHLLLSYGFAAQALQNFQLLWIPQTFISAAGCTAVMMLLSCLLPGAADVGILLLTFAVYFVMMMLQHGAHVPGMEDIGTQLLSIAFPSFDLTEITAPRSLLSIDVGRYVAVVFVSLLGSVIVLNQKELSYGSH